MFCVIMQPTHKCRMTFPPIYIMEGRKPTPVKGLASNYAMSCCNNSSVRMIAANSSIEMSVDGIMDW